MFINKYLHELEKHTHLWVQMFIVEVEDIQSSLPDDKKIILSRYHHPHPVTSSEWIEFHVDDVHFVYEQNFGPFDGNVSIRSLPGSKTVIIFGQDESIFNQFSHSASSGCDHWVNIQICPRLLTFFALAEPTQLLDPQVDSDQTNALGHCPWCWDEDSLFGLGLALPHAMQ